MSVKVCSWYKTHSKTGNLAGVQYVSILSVPGPVIVSFEAFSGRKKMMYTLKVAFAIFNNLIRDRGFNCHRIINGRVELVVEYTIRRLLSKILHSIQHCVLLCFIKPILGDCYVRYQGFIVRELRETQPRSEIADIPTSPCPPLDNLGCPPLDKMGII